jgi:hypothetical protein
MVLAKTKISIALLEKLREAELSLIPDKPKRRSSKAVRFDKRFSPKSELPQYIALFFIVYQQDILNAGHRWKDFIMDVMDQRESGIEVYNSYFIPEDNKK